jgi:hypothetical protein
MTNTQLTRITPETRRLLVEFSDVLPRFEQSIRKWPIEWTTFTGIQMRAEQIQIPSELITRWTEVREALAKCSEPEIAELTRKLDFTYYDDKIADEASAKAAQDELQAAEYALYRLGLDIKDLK